LLAGDFEGEWPIDEAATRNRCTIPMGPHKKKPRRIAPGLKKHTKGEEVPSVVYNTLRGLLLGTGANGHISNFRELLGSLGHSVEGLVGGGDGGLGKGEGRLGPGRRIL